MAGGEGLFLMGVKHYGFGDKEGVLQSERVKDLEKKRILARKELESENIRLPE